MLSLIVAVAHGNVIGYQGKMPWHLPAELAYFKSVTMGKPVVMGRKTFDSIVASLGKPLPGRRNIVVTANAAWHANGTSGVERASSVEEALAIVRDADGFVIGGASLYEAALPLAARVYLTQIDATVPGDTFFPPLDPLQWREVSRTARARDEKNANDMSFVVYERVAG
jgi:dihydrofolate reductase